jgi:hypothetical protein
MPRFSVQSLRFSLGKSSLSKLLLCWLGAYVGFAVLCAILYSRTCTVSDVRENSVHGLANLLYFSFTTQSTVGYGDYAPVGYGRLISVVQSLVGMAMNALLLGIAAVKVLKPSFPIIFPQYVVYELKAHDFWFRFMNIDPDRLREVTVCLVISKSPDAAERLKPGAYDTIANYVNLPFSSWQVCPSDVHMALRTVSNNGKGAPAFRGHGEMIDASPALFFSDLQNQSCPVVKLTLTIKGYFETTGDQFFGSKEYDVSSIRCGQFEDVSKSALSALGGSKQAAALSKTIPSSSLDCTSCPYHHGCAFDVAQETRKTESG